MDNETYKAALAILLEMERLVDYAIAQLVEIKKSESSDLTTIANFIEKERRLSDTLSISINKNTDIKCDDETLIQEMNMAAFLSKNEDGTLNEHRFARGFANRVLMKWGDKEGVYKMLSTPFSK